jgi:malonate decarboxylase epsilon subunit
MRPQQRQPCSWQWTHPRVTYVSNANARALRAAQQVASDLANNIAHAVRWHDSTTLIKELGCKLVLEMPPGHVLTDLAKESIPEVSALPVENQILLRVLRLAQRESNRD